MIRRRRTAGLVLALYTAAVLAVLALQGPDTQAGAAARTRPPSPHTQVDEGVGGALPYCKNIEAVGQPPVNLDAVDECVRAPNLINPSVCLISNICLNSKREFFFSEHKQSSSTNPINELLRALHFRQVAHHQQKTRWENVNGTTTLWTRTPLGGQYYWHVLSEDALAIFSGLHALHVGGLPALLSLSLHAASPVLPTNILFLDRGGAQNVGLFKTLFVSAGGRVMYTTDLPMHDFTCFARMVVVGGTPLWNERNFVSSKASSLQAQYMSSWALNRILCGGASRFSDKSLTTRPVVPIPSSSSPARIVFVKRSGWRRILNEPALVDVLRARSRDVHWMELGELTFEQQAALMGGTSLFVSLWGSSVSNFMFLPQRAVVLQLFPYGMRGLEFTDWVPMFPFLHLVELENEHRSNSIPPYEKFPEQNSAELEAFYKVPMFQGGNRAFWMNQDTVFDEAEFAAAVDAALRLVGTDPRAA
mmetsp:Transcript_7030/g.17786  ORF Transcript_7030/g.17786 Transcript_7030/m.17786 type:complete len:476 (-) Transcript_7030:291-1718(-)